MWQCYFANMLCNTAGQIQKLFKQCNSASTTMWFIGTPINCYTKVCNNVARVYGSHESSVWSCLEIAINITCVCEVSIDVLTLKICLIWTDNVLLYFICERNRITKADIWFQGHFFIFYSLFITLINYNFFNLQLRIYMVSSFGYFCAVYQLE